MPDQAEPTYATAADFLTKVEHPAKDVQLPSGRLVRVRGLTRAELIAGGAGTEDPAEVERRNVATCLVNPAMNREMVRKWQANPGSVADLAKITEAIRDLSGLGEGAQKSDVAQARNGA